MRSWLYVAALTGLVVVSQAQAQQAQQTQDPTAVNSPTAIGPDPMRAHDAGVSPQERVENGAQPDARKRDKAGKPETTYRCPDGKGGTKVSKVAGKGCTLESIVTD